MQVWVDGRASASNVKAVCRLSSTWHCSPLRTCPTSWAARRAYQQGQDKWRPLLLAPCMPLQSAAACSHIWHAPVSRSSQDHRGGCAMCQPGCPAGTSASQCAHHITSSSHQNLHGSRRISSDGSRGGRSGDASMCSQNFSARAKLCPC